MDIDECRRIRNAHRPGTLPTSVIYRAFGEMKVQTRQTFEAVDYPA
jgi:hypothetical protein